tara:strand:+ start:741 stop:1370 length:630 start_codon:yes stop_codon:yes gene_type:complete
MAQQLNSGGIDALKQGETLLIEARKVANGKIQLEFAEMLNTGARAKNALTVLNKSDDRFSGGKPRRAWVTAEPADVGELLGVDLGDTGEWYEAQRRGKTYEILDLNILNPVDFDAERFRVICEETLTPSEYHSQDPESYAKKKGKDGDLILHNGCYIFSYTSVAVTNEPTDDMHTWLKSDAASSTSIGGIKANVTTSKVAAGELDEAFM